MHVQLNFLFESGTNARTRLLTSFPRCYSADCESQRADKWSVNVPLPSCRPLLPNSHIARRWYSCQIYCTRIFRVPYDETFKRPQKTQFDRWILDISCGPSTWHVHASVQILSESDLPKVQQMDPRSRVKCWNLDCYKVQTPTMVPNVDPPPWFPLWILDTAMLVYKAQFRVSGRVVNRGTISITPRVHEDVF